MEVTNFLLNHKQAKHSFEQRETVTVGLGSLLYFGSSASATQVLSARCWCLLTGTSEQWFTTCKIYGLYAPIKDDEIKQVLTM